MCFITFYNKINDISDDSNDFNLLTNKIRLSIEYIVRKNIYIENQIFLKRNRGVFLK